MGTLHLRLKKGQYIVSSHVGGLGAEPPVSALMGAAEGRVDLRLKVLVSFLCFLAQNLARSKAVIVLSLNQKDWRLGEIHRPNQPLSKRQILVPRHWRRERTTPAPERPVRSPMRRVWMPP